MLSFQNFLLIAFCSGVCSLDSLPDCTNLTDIEPRLEVAVNGSFLTLCRTDGDQCCTQEYLDIQTSRTIENLMNGLQRELLGGNYNILETMNTTLFKFMRTTFAEAFIDRLPGAYAIRNNNIQNMLEEFVLILAENNTVSEIRSGYEAIIDTLQRSVVRDYIAANTPLTNIHVHCIVSFLDDHINQTVGTEIISRLQTVRKTVGILEDLTQFYAKQLIPSLVAIPPTNDCTETFISLRCAACNRAIPELCHSVCGQLVRGCFSPYRRGLANELDILWNVTQQIVEILEMQVDAMLLLESDLFTLDFSDTTAMRNFIFSIVLSTCIVAVNPNTFNALPNTEPTEVNLPDEVALNVTRLKGSFEYDPDGPLVCESNPFINCWNGMQKLTMDIEETFTTDDILDQDDNPIVSFNRQGLVNVAVSIGTPVSDYFSQEQDIPNEVIIPSGTIFFLDVPEDSTSRIRTTSVSALPSQSVTSTTMQDTPSSPTTSPIITVQSGPRPSSGQRVSCGVAVMITVIILGIIIQL